MNKVTVVRYLRPPVKQAVKGLVSVYTAERSNLGGVTFLFDLDYVNRQVVTYFSICNSKENFNKQLGIETARDAGVVRIMPLDGFRELADQEGGFVDAYFTLLNVHSKMDRSSIDEREELLLKKADYIHWRQ